MSRKKLQLTCRPIAMQTAPNVLVPNSDVEQLRDAALVYKDTYKQLFGSKVSKQSGYWKPQIVKIVYGNRCINRRLLVSSTKGLTSQTIGITFSSIGELTNYSQNGTNNSPQDKVVTISRGSRLAYWRRHPNPAARISFVLGAWSIVIGLFSIALSILLNFYDKI